MTGQRAPVGPYPASRRSAAARSIQHLVGPKQSSCGALLRQTATRVRGTAAGHRSQVGGAAKELCGAGVAAAVWHLTGTEQCFCRPGREARLRLRPAGGVGALAVSPSAVTRIVVGTAAGFATYGGCDCCHHGEPGSSADFWSIFKPGLPRFTSDSFMGSQTFRAGVSLPTRRSIAC